VITLNPASGARGRGQTAVTDAKGRFQFAKVAPGAYTVRSRAPAGWVAVGDEVAKVSASGTRTELEFRYRFERRVALGQAPYTALGDLVALPGRPSGAPLVGPKSPPAGSKG
jgi:hypothetical protein